MSQAFIRESDGQSLQDIPPTLSALVNYLTRENNGIRVYERENKINALGESIHSMSNGLTYIKKGGMWQEYSVG